jgi:ABC-type transporter Mla subunit MlaD
MANERSQNRKPLFGALILLAIIVVAALIFSVQWIFHATKPPFELIGLLPDATAIDGNTKVWIAGKQVGSVKSINFRGAQTDSASRLAVTLEIPREDASQVRQDGYVRVTSSRLVGEPVVDIVPGTPAAPAVRNGDTLRMSVHGTLEGIMDKTEMLTRDFDRLIVDMRGVQTGAQRGSARMQKLQDNLASVMTEFRDFNESLRASPTHSAQVEVQAALKRLQANNAELQKALHQAMQRAQAARTDMQPALRQMMARADTISGVVAELRRRVTENGGGLLLRAQKDSAIVKALHEATIQLDSLMAETRRNPLRFWF